MKPRILVVGHEATLTGASLVLLEILRVLKDGTGWELDVALLRGGELFEEYADVADSLHVLRLDRLQRRAELSTALASRVGLGRPAHALEAVIVNGGKASTRGYDAVYANSTPSLAALRRPVRAPVLFHCHELQAARSTSLRGQDAPLLRELPAIYAVASEAIATDLTSDGSIDRSVVHVVHPFPVAAIRPLGDADASQLRSRLGIPPGAKVVLGCGTVGRNKGIDLFLQAALGARHHAPHVQAHWLWLGDAPDPVLDQLVQEDIRRSGLSAFVQRVPATRDVSPFFAVADLLCLPSRDDAYPVVMLEAGAAGIPTVAFEGSGGATEFIRRSRGGLLAPWLDSLSLAASIVSLLEDDSERQALGRHAREYVLANHQPSSAAAAIQGLLELVLDRP